MNLLYFAPLEGVTDAVFRQVHHACFGGVTKYFIPFISPTQNLRLTSRELSAVDPQCNAGVPVVPQVLTKNAQHFLWAARTLCDMGYEEVNLNLGCPSGTVTAKGKGAGMLCDVPALSHFLDEIFSDAPLPISIKTRIGFADAEEFPALLAVFNQYPIAELTLHPRTRTQFYTGVPHRERFRAACTQTKLPLVYNGDLFTEADCRALTQSCPTVHALMLGRGLIANPALAQTLHGGAALTLPQLRRFHDELAARYLAMYPPHAALGRMREVMKHLLCCFDEPKKTAKALRKAANWSSYEALSAELFDTHPLKALPAFDPNC